MRDDFYQRIRQEAIAVCGDASTILVYAEVEDGAISADLHFQRRQDAVVQFRFAPEQLQDLIYAFWELGEGDIAPCSWAVLRLVLADGKFTADLTYPDQLDPDEGLPERRPIAVRECFPNLQVDYSKPHG